MSIKTGNGLVREKRHPGPPFAEGSEKILNKVNGNDKLTFLYPDWRKKQNQQWIMDLFPPRTLVLNRPQHFSIAFYLIKVLQPKSGKR